jgi:hypothetical protein
VSSFIAEEQSRDTTTTTTIIIIIIIIGLPLQFRNAKIIITDS